MKNILEKVKKYMSKNGNLKISKASINKKTGDYVFLFDYSNGEEYQDAFIFNPKTNEERVINVFSLLIDDSEKGITDADYEDITIAD